MGKKSQRELRDLAGAAAPARGFWGSWFAWLEADHRRSAQPFPATLSAQARWQAITHAEYLDHVREHPYLRRRWPYYRAAIELAQRLSPSRVLEIGSRTMPLLRGSDSLDIDERFRPTILHDATVVPWPIDDRRYDLVIALQVWEHLGDRQEQAFRELRRCARYAILSLPYNWRSRHDPSHSGIDDAVVARWSGGLEPIESILVPRFGQHRRKIYFFDLHPTW